MRMPKNHLDDSKLTIGFVTKQQLLKLLDDSDISALSPKKFYKGVRAFYLKATFQTLQKLPFGTRFVNFEKEKCTFDSVGFFCSKYSDLLKYTPAQMDRLQEE